MIKIVEISAAIVVSLMLSGCGNDRDEAKQAVLEVLKDPDSAKFGEFTQVGDDSACLTVNAKNSMGGYTGDQQAQLRKNKDGKWESYDITEISHESCILIPEREAAAAQAEAAAAKVKAERTARLVVVDAGDGVLSQPAASLEWTQFDNGTDIDWNNAGEYCTGKGSGWRLPTKAELLSIYDEAGKFITSCGPVTCKVSPLYRLSNSLFWSNEAYGSVEAWSVDLYYGTRDSTTVSHAYTARALCVRPS